MTEEDHKTLLRRLARAFNSRNRKAFEALFSPHFVLHDPQHPHWPKGLEGARRLWTTLLTTAPDMQLTIGDLVSEEDKIVVCWTCQGTVPAGVPGHTAGDPFTAVSIAIYRIMNSKIEEEWGIARVLGTAQRKAAAAAPFGGRAEW